MTTLLDFESKPKRVKAQKWEGPAVSDFAEFQTIAGGFDLYARAEGDELILNGPNGKFGVRPGQIAILSADVYGGLSEEEFTAQYGEVPAGE